MRVFYGVFVTALIACAQDFEEIFVPILSGNAGAINVDDAVENVAGGVVDNVVEEVAPLEPCTCNCCKKPNEGLCVQKGFLDKAEVNAKCSSFANADEANGIPATPSCTPTYEQKKNMPWATTSEAPYAKFCTDMCDLPKEGSDVDTTCYVRVNFNSDAPRNLGIKKAPTNATGEQEEEEEARPDSPAGAPASAEEEAAQEAGAAENKPNMQAVETRTAATETRAATAELVTQTAVAKAQAYARKAEKAQTDNAASVLTLRGLQTQGKIHAKAAAKASTNMLKIRREMDKLAKKAADRVAEEAFQIVNKAADEAEEHARIMYAIANPVIPPMRLAAVRAMGPYFAGAGNVMGISGLYSGIAQGKASSAKTKQAQAKDLSEYIATYNAAGNNAQAQAVRDQASGLFAAAQEELSQARRYQAIARAAAAGVPSYLVNAEMAGRRAAVLADGEIPPPMP